MLRMVLVWILSASSLPAEALTNFQNTHIFDGVFIARDRPLEGCLDACVDATENERLGGPCMGFDYNSVQRTCWLHGRNTICAQQYDKESCVHYSFVECPKSTFVEQAVYRFDNQHLQGGILQDQVDNIADCLELCAFDEACGGFDFDITDNGCWLHRDTECTEILSREGTTHYRFRQCDGIEQTTPPTRSPSTPAPNNQNNVLPQLETFRSFPQQSIPNGRPLPYIDSKPDCFDICWTNERCTGFDWNQRLMRCRVHDAETECNSMRIDPGTTHYRVRSQCPGQQAPDVEEALPPLFPRPVTTPSPPTPAPVNLFPQTPSPLCNTQLAPFTTEIGFRQGGDFFVARGVSLEQCQRLCRFTPVCGGFNWDIVEQGCYLISGQGLGAAVQDSCCVYSRMECDSDFINGDANVVNPDRQVTTLSPQTDSPSLVPLPSTPIRADGFCPEAELYEYQFSILFGQSVPVPGVDNVEVCKHTCLLNSACTGADFNLQHPRPGLSCFLHLGPITDDQQLRSNQPCCSHFRKTACNIKQCLVHDPIEIENIGSADVLSVFDTLDIRPTGGFSAQLASCTGACVTETAFSYDESGQRIDFRSPITISRRCAEAEVLPAGVSGDSFQCESRFEADGDLDTKVCFCPGHACNAFGVIIFPVISAYFPFDRTTDDFSFARRTGFAVNVEFDPIDTQKNGSAVFDGTSYVMVPTFAGVSFSNNNGIANSHQPTFAVTTWVKRDGVIGRGVILTNGRRDRATLEIYSEIDATTTHRVYASVKINGTVHSVNATAPINEWFFLAVMVISHIPSPKLGSPPVNNNYYLVMHINDVFLVDSFTDTGLPVTGTGVTSTDITVEPLCIGKQLTIPDRGGFPEPEDMLRGQLDELFMFSDSFTTTYLEAIKGSSEYPGQLFFP